MNLVKYIFRKKAYNDVGYFGEQLTRNISDLKRGDLSRIPWIFCVFSESHEASKETAAKALKKVLKRLSFDNIIRVDNQMRQTTSVEWSIDWRSLNIEGFLTPQMSAEEIRAVIIFSSFNPNGFIREKAVYAMKKLEGTLPYILLRGNDWVREVRTAATVAFSYRLEHLSEGELLATLPFAEKMEKSTRGEAFLFLKPLYDRILKPQHHNDLMNGLRDSNIRVRRVCIKALLESPSTHTHIMVEQLKCEPEPFLRTLIFKKMIELQLDTDDVVDQFVKDKFPMNRMLAFRYLIDQKNESFAEVILNFLLDKSSSIRTLAQQLICEKVAHFDLREFYITEMASSHVAVAILGLGESGFKEDGEKVVQYLESTHTRVVKSAMLALMMLDAARYRDKIMEMLKDERKGVVKTARNLILKDGNPNYDVVKSIFDESDNDNTKLKCFSILLTTPKWVRLIYILEALQSGNETVKWEALHSLRIWIIHFNRSFASASTIEKARVIQLLDDLDSILAEDLKGQIKFLML